MAARGKEHWFRSYHGAPTDPKWILIARKAGEGVTPGMVAALWWALMDHASQNTPRGSIEGFDVEVVAEFFGYDETHCNAVIAALRNRGIIDGNVLAAWDRRQPKREDASTERVRNFRARQQDSPQETQGNAPETHGNARGEERRGEKKEKPSASRNRAHQLPGDWQPNDSHRGLAAKHGADLEFEVEQFRDHAEATGRTLKNWDAGFRTWLRKATPRKHMNGGGPARRITGDYLAAVLLSAGSLVWQPSTRDEALNRLAERYSDEEWDELCPLFESMPWHEVVPAQSDKFLLREVLNRHIERHAHADA